jgi:two-component system, NarL family, nitrate/nitrite response regulator NarL
MRVPVAIVDEHPLTAWAMRKILPSHHFEVVSEGRTADEAASIAAAGQSRIIIIELTVPGNIMATIHSIRAMNSDIKVLIYTAVPGIDSAVRSLEAGANGYVSKASSIEELLLAMGSVLQGETYISRSFSTGVITALQNASVRRLALHALRLSVREDQTIHLLLAGKTNREIAIQLKVSERTVKHYMSCLMQKLNARSRIEVILAAQRMNCAVPEPITLGSAAYHAIN